MHENIYIGVPYPLLFATKRILTETCELRIWNEAYNVANITEMSSRKLRIYFP
jgi:hypothetical protein